MPRIVSQLGMLTCPEPACPRAVPAVEVEAILAAEPDWLQKFRRFTRAIEVGTLGVGGRHSATPRGLAAAHNGDCP